MNINEDNILYPGHNNEELALACLLANGVCFLNHLNSGTEEDPRWTTCVYVDASDIFVWGCADGEDITNNDGEDDSEIITLYKLWKENSNLGPIKWLCLKRNEQPQRPVKEMMIKDNYWDETLENLPQNKYDLFLKSRK